MSKEFETKVININPDELNNKLESLGATKGDEVLLRRWVFDLSIKEEITEFIRLRDNGNKVTLTYKYKTGNNISDVEEIEVKVDDFDHMYVILSKLKNWTRVIYQENQRTIYTLKDIEFAIDVWPNINPYLEVESHSEEKVIEGLKLLGLEGKDAGNISVTDIYKEKGIDLNSIAELRFDK